VDQITSVREQDGVLFMGTLQNRWLARYTPRTRFVPLRVGEKEKP
jgi:hypothetical protein